MSLATTVCLPEEGVPSATSHALVDCGIECIIYLGHANMICPTVDVNNLGASDQQTLANLFVDTPRTPLFNIVGITGKLFQTPSNIKEWSAREQLSRNPNMTEIVGGPKIININRLRKTYAFVVHS